MPYALHWILVIFLGIASFLSRGSPFAVPLAVFAGIYALALMLLLLTRRLVESAKGWWATRRLDARERRIRERDAHTESPLERSLAAELDRQGISYEREYLISRTRVDFAFPRAKLAVECDGWRYHHDRWTQDAKRDAFLRSRGWTVLRFSGESIRADVRACVRKIAERL